MHIGVMAEQLESLPLLTGGGGGANSAAAQQMLLNSGGAPGGGKQRNLSTGTASANLINTIVGAGMMALPAAYLSLGLIGGSAVMALLVIVSAYQFGLHTTLLTWVGDWLPMCGRERKPSGLAVSTASDARRAAPCELCLSPSFAMLQIGLVVAGGR